MSQMFFASNLVALRDASDWKLKALSAACAIDVPRLIQLEQEDAPPTPHELLVLSKTFDITVDRLLRVDLQAINEIKAVAEIRFLALDVDGVMTDGGLYYAEDGTVSKKFNVKDGVAISRLTQSGFQVGFISSGTSENLVSARARRLGVQRTQCEVVSKLEVLSNWCSELDIGLKNVAFIGDDVNDLETISQCGLSACPSDAVDDIKKVVTWVLEKKGGDGCVREFVDSFLSVSVLQ